ncbi:UNVERIFIED_CONTAM: Retrovirus-related Pol polyprotein from transposon TNT 1-94 [Sesamum latifolium]|uniref:Retrovirus-related Pol polyprotein from transposon TNT 1-94 n=1 Tax=Sesamum latifolium TaxID=2727402 RepID=A0AAW2WF85_9LAMI
MTDVIQKQYDRLDDVPSIILRMKEVYAVPDRHIRYAATKAFFETKMTEDSSVQSPGVKMLSLVEKLEYLKAGLDNDTYIDVILQSLPPSYDPFIIHYNMNGLEKTIHELINMLVQYKAMTHKSVPAALVGEASTSKAKGKRAERWKRKNDKRKDVAATASSEGTPVAPKGKSKGKVGGSHNQRQMMFACIVKKRGIGRGSVHNSSPTQVLERSRRLSKDEIILRLDDGNVVATEAMGSVSLVISDHIRIELKDCYYAPSASLRPLKGSRNTDFEVENQTGRKIKALQSDRGGEELDPIGYGSIHDEFYEIAPILLGYILDTAAKLLNMALSKTVPQTPYKIWHGKPTSYKYLRVWGSPTYVKRLVGDKLDSRSFLFRFIGYPKETAGYYFYDPSEQKIFISRSAVLLEKGFPADSRWDEVLHEESSEAPQQNDATSVEPSVPTNGVPILRRSTRESRPPERYGVVGLTSQLDNDPRIYGEAMSDIDSDKWLEAMKSKIDSMGSNQLGAGGEVTAFKAGLGAKGCTQRPGVNFEETYSPVAMAKSIRILLAIAAWFIYGLKQAFRSWNTHFDEVIRGYNFIKNEHDLCVYKKINGSSVAYIVLYVDDILLIGNNVKMLGDIKA